MKIKIILFCLLGILIGVWSYFSVGILFIFILVLSICLLLWICFIQNERRFLVVLFLLALLIRVPLASSHYIISLNLQRGVDFFGDALNYSNNALYITEVITKKDFSDYEKYDPRLAESMQIARDLYKGELPSPHTYQIRYFAYLLAFLYWLFGYSPLIVKLINCLLGALTAVVVYILAQQLFNTKAARLASVLTAFFPSLILWSITGLRDTALIFFIFVSFLILFQIMNKGKITYFPALFIALFIFFLLRFHILFALVPCLLIYIFMKFKLSQKILCGTVFATFILLIFLLPQGKLYREKFWVYYNYNLSFKSMVTHQLSHYRHPYSPAYRIYPERLYTSSPSRPSYISGHLPINLTFSEIIISCIKGVLYFQFSPFPWDINKLSHLFIYPQTVVLYMLFPFVVLGVVLGLKSCGQETLCIVLFILTIWIFFGMREGNIGTVFRHRDMLTPFFLVFASGGFSKLFILPDGS